MTIMMAPSDTSLSAAIRSLCMYRCREALLLLPVFRKHHQTSCFLDVSRRKPNRLTFASPLRLGCPEIHDAVFGAVSATYAQAQDLLGIVLIDLHFGFHPSGRLPFSSKYLDK